MCSVLAREKITKELKLEVLKLASDVKHITEAKDFEMMK